jgi:hypothetical protein
MRLEGRSNRGGVIAIVVVALIAIAVIAIYLLVLAPR